MILIIVIILIITTSIIILRRFTLAANIDPNSMVVALLAEDTCMIKKMVVLV